jgi:hypothetical protein
MKSFISILILSLFAVTAFTWDPTPNYCDDWGSFTQDDVDNCMLIAIQTCPGATLSGCDLVRPDPDYVPVYADMYCYEACSLCLNCVYESGPACCINAIWITQFNPCVNYCSSFL